MYRYFTCALVFRNCVDLSGRCRGERMFPTSNFDVEKTMGYFINNSASCSNSC